MPCLAAYLFSHRSTVERRKEEMGKGSELWDDSALVNAFDHAMSSYKEMHLTNYYGKSTKEGKHASDRNGKDLIPVENTAGHVVSEDNINTISEETTKTSLSSDITDNKELALEDISTQGNYFCADEHTSGADPCSAGFPSTDGKNYSHFNQQSMDYDQLVRQYHDLEEQRQKVIQQLYKANYWNYQTPVQTSTCQLPQVCGYDVSKHGLQTPCSLCSCHCMAIPLISSACAGGHHCPFQMACCSGSHQIAGNQYSVDNGPHSTATTSAVDPVNHSKTDDNAVNLGMLAIDSAMNSMKVPITSNGSEGKGGNHVSSVASEGNVSQGVSSETDLTAVLNAWYLAGFHTGRYLSEQSKKNAQLK